jgi:hypothetical protein
MVRIAPLFRWSAFKERPLLARSGHSTNGIKAVAAEPDEFADRGVARELADELGFDRRPLLHHAVGGDPR